MLGAPLVEIATGHRARPGSRGRLRLVALEPMIARRTWRTVEPLHGMIYFAAEAQAAYADSGLADARMGYFASRSAPMGPVRAEIVIATFFNFAPALVHDAIPAAWSIVTPERLLEARRTAADRALRRALGDLVRSEAVREAAALARRAAERACERPEGRALFAAHAGLDWPDEPHLVLWHAQTLLREFRGDAHVAALLAAELTGIEALVTHAASGEVPAAMLQATRAWDDVQWAAAVGALRSRGWLAAGPGVAFTDEGRRRRNEIEDRTDALSAFAYEPLGEEGCARLRALARPLSRAVVDAGLLSPTRVRDRR